MSGWLKINRNLRNHWCASDPNFLAVWFHLLAEANWEDKKTLLNGNLVIVKKGQCVFGLNAWSAKTGVSVMKLRRIIDVMIEDGMINRQKTNKYSIISITKWEEYQSGNNQKTIKQQSDNNQTTTPKELKEIKEDKEKNICEVKFAEFWDAYPNRSGGNPKKTAKDKFVKICKDGVSPDDIIIGAKKYAKANQDRIGTPYIAQATTWLNQERWLDDYEIQKTSKLNEDLEDWL